MSAGDSGVCNHVKVAVRVRPESGREREGGFRKVVHVVDGHMLVFDPKEQEVSFFHKKAPGRDITKKANKDLKFVFDHVFGEGASQLQVFENSTKGIVDGVLNGYNCTVFAYGATGAGKTHTMLGSAEDPGVMYHTMKELYSRIEQVQDEKVFDIAVSYLEVYNEQIRDLLTNSGPLAVREDSAKGVVVQGLTLHQPKSTEHILEALDYGNRNRTQHPTDVNACSSRSHAVFQVYVRQREKTAGLNQDVRIAKMSLIDLAGSERARATNAKGARFREGANINRSLLALGNVINALADPKSKKSHIPYRDSKLTRLLKDSLGGNCRTIMIANVSPSSMSYEDTYNTLKYANRAKDIKSSLKSNVVSLDSHVSQYAVICEKQSKEILMLRQKLKEYEEKSLALPESRRLSLMAVSRHKQAEIENYSIWSLRAADPSLLKIQNSREARQNVLITVKCIRRDFLNLERQLKENELKTYYREQCHQQIQLLCSYDKAEKATCKHERRMASLQTQRLHLQRRLQEAERRFEENASWLHRVENEMKIFDHDGQVPKVLQKDLQCHRLQLEVLDLQQHIEHMTHLISLQDQENKQTKNSAVFDQLRVAKQFLALREAGLAGPAGEAEFRELEQLVQREKGVAWADQSVAEEPGRGAPSQEELASVLSFSHLACHQNTPCSSEKPKRKSFQSTAPEATIKGSPAKSQEDVLRKPARRKLAVSPLARSCADNSQQQPRVSTLQGTFCAEGVFPLQYTPEVCRTAEPPGHTCGDAGAPPESVNLTFDLSEECERSSNLTAIISPGTGKLDTVLGYGKSSYLSGPGVPLPAGETLARQPKPSYMAMTSAAQGKRKLSSFSVLRDAIKENTQGPTIAKRLRNDSFLSSKPMRVPRLKGPEEPMPARRVVRSVSEGNLSLAGVKKQPRRFMGTAKLFKRASKQS
ncbi:KI18A protein, partial [Atractosteus spatula]|nr:KI18A protein [Atractosteus spatula]